MAESERIQELERQVERLDQSYQTACAALREASNAFLANDRERMKDILTRFGAESKAFRLAMEHREEVARLRTALAFYADEESYEIRQPVPGRLAGYKECIAVAGDGGQRARAALDGDESSVYSIWLEREEQKLLWPEYHDDTHEEGELAGIAAMLAASVADEESDKIGVVVHVDGVPHHRDPWGLIGRHKDPRKRLIVAGALIAAELDRRTRAALAEQEQEASDGPGT